VRLHIDRIGQCAGRGRYLESFLAEHRQLARRAGIEGNKVGQGFGAASRQGGEIRGHVILQFEIQNNGLVRHHVGGTGEIGDLDDLGARRAQYRQRARE
jgi:hypothetical protein